MAEFKLDRFKYRWRNEWQPSTAYRRDDIVRVSGKSYVCLIAHTSDPDFGVDLNAIVPDSDPPVPAPKWTLMTNGKSFRGNWNTSTIYYLGDIVLEGGRLYVANTVHTSSLFENEVDNWDIFADHINWENEWQTSTTYAPGDLVRYNGIVYRCIEAHTSSVLEDQLNFWEEFFVGTEFVGSWSQITEYRKNDLVKYGGSIFKCIQTHTSALEFDGDKFEMHIPGFQYDGEWDVNTTYQKGDIVSYGGDLYYALQNNTGRDPFELPDDSFDNWTKLADSYNFRGVWAGGETYRPGDIVQRGGNLYIARIDINGVDFDGSTLDIIEDPDRWELLKTGQNYAMNWSEDKTYNINDVVLFRGTAWICKFPHLSDSLNRPGENLSGLDYWDILSEAGSEVGLENPGDLLSYGLTRAEFGDGSTQGPVSVPIGERDQLLSVANEQDLFWRTYINDADVVYVSQTGSDLTGDGTKYYPFASVRHAAEYVEDNYAPLQPVTIHVATGRYFEKLPISVPAGCAVMGDELRATTIEACRPLPEYADPDYDMVSQYWNHFLTFVDSLLREIPFEKTTGNNLEVTNLGLNISDAAAANIGLKITDWKNRVEFEIRSGDINPTVVGTNTATLDEETLNTVAMLNANEDFIAEELFAFMVQTYTDVEHNEEKVKLDVKHVLRAVKYDLEYPGNYKTLLSARRYISAVKGSQLEDMFYVRDTTGVRNCTVEGLEGLLNPPVAFEIFQRPTGGAYVSLDPGWGPADNRTWINNRSPYIQGVTTLGYGAIGQKVDGALHNGGNKSITSNDFTQVISDGIGAWILNNARAELVSVFTYYASIGYFAENGGIIRATNGNNSYGNVGALADGIDPTETPQTAKIFNRNNEALVGGVFAGEFTDKVFALEYVHAGEEYTQAQANVVGAGANIDLEFRDFRDGGISQLRLINPAGSGAVGGAGYFISQGNAQGGDSTSITLSSNEPGLEVDLLGTRLYIVSGDGTGQFGYIQAYNEVTKIATIYKESTDTPGWDHLVPGTPIEPSLSINAQYRIEPRVTVSSPGFTSDVFSLDANTDVVDSIFGETSATFEGVTGQLGTGTTIEVGPASARFTVERNAGNYTVEIEDGGAGYAVGDTITIPGTDLDGASPANDLTITVTSITDDSTNAIDGLTIEGTAVGGRFVVLSTPNFIQYSDDGTSWTQTLLPSVQDWRQLAAGNGAFVAVAAGTNTVAYSGDGVSWVSRNIGATADWTDVAFGQGKFVAIAENSNTVAYSSDGLTWNTTTIPSDPASDSTANQWSKIAYGQGKFVVISSSGVATAQSNDGINWTLYDDSSQLPVVGVDWIGLVFGRNIWLAVGADGTLAYSLDGNIWDLNIEGMPSPDGSTAMSWKDIKYAQGIFFAVCDTGSAVIGADPTFGPTRYAVTSEDGFNWIERELTGLALWTTVAFGRVNAVGTWIAVADNQESDSVNRIYTGATARLRAAVAGGSFSAIEILDPGSGYDRENPPTITIVDNNFSTEVGFQTRIRNRVLAQPDFVNRGVGYRTSTTTVTITGDGFADIIPEGKSITLNGVTTVPGPGTQIEIDGIFDLDTPQETDLIGFRAVIVEDLGDDGTGAGTRLVRMQISPSLEVEYNLAHGTNVSLRERFSQCRISGHDFLDIGTGNFEETNYPEIYAGGNFFTASPENEVIELNSGRVFYTSTDQDGNFRAGELFSVEQATGVVTISADFFSLDGLSELALGGVRLGGSGTVIREFSTDSNFTEDSNNVIPTQRAIAVFLAQRLSEGGDNLEVNTVVAGQTRVGTENNIIDTLSRAEVRVPVPVRFNVSPTGTIIAQNMFLRSPFERETMN